MAYQAVRLKRRFLPSLLLAAIAGCGNPQSATQEVKERQQSATYKPGIAVVYSPNYLIQLMKLEKLHPFDIKKYARIHDQLVNDGFLKPDDVYVPEAISDEDILRVHTAEFVESLRSSRTVARYIEAPFLGMIPNRTLQKRVLTPFRLSSGGTLLAARLALKTGIAVNIGGGYHHAKPQAGEGFCIFADIPIAIRTLREEGLISRVVIIDLDVHQGNGTAVCLADDEDSFTFSIHQENIYPIPKEASDLDVGLDSGTGDREYLETLKSHLPKVLNRAKADIAFIVAGCDTLADDPLASLAMTKQGIVERDALAVHACRERNIPVIVTLGGGYSPDAWKAQYMSISHLITQYGLHRQFNPDPPESE